MRRELKLVKRGCTLPIVLTMLSFFATSAPCAVVSESEAVGVADLWYAMELNSGLLKIDQREKQDRLARLHSREVKYFVSGDTLLDHPPDEGLTLAYVVIYKPTGFVVVAGDDRIQPIVVFDAKSAFRWGTPKRNFLRYFLSREMPKRWARSEGGMHPVWSLLRSRSSEQLDQVTFPKGERNTYVRWDTPLWGQGPPYNEVVIANNGGIDSIPTGCTATAMAIKMRFHSWPPVGHGWHGYSDLEGDVQFYHFVVFEGHTYAWQNMPDTSLAAPDDTSLAAPNLDVANLMYHCGVAVNMNYEVHRSGAWPTASSMSDFFDYKGTLKIDTLDEHDVYMRSSILGGLPVVCSTTDHTVVADGYRDTETPFWHLNCGWDGPGGWYYLYTGFPGEDDHCIDESYPYSSPQNYMYVQAGFAGPALGLLQFPFPSIPEGVSAVPENGHLWVWGTTYPAPVYFDKAMTIRSYMGTTNVGGKLSLTTSGMIRTYGTGRLAIY